MPPRRRAQCQICTTNESKYSCSGCLAPYCSVPCYKEHKETCIPVPGSSSKRTTDDPPSGKLPEQDVAMNLDIGAPPHDGDTETPLEEPRTLRPLTSLNWPYHALQKALGVAPSDIRDIVAPADLGDDVLAFRKLAEAVESAVRGKDSSTLGLDWGE
ncbi:hypothetical protein BD779DRAFT_1520201 [Infundibulicybe gibba]|nr:hypothetical protein BD779DRAFT_1520201 [Infundibulicybe gibba]